MDSHGIPIPSDAKPLDSRGCRRYRHRRHARDETEWSNSDLAIRGPAVAGLLAGFIDNWAGQNDDSFASRSEPLAGPWSMSLRRTDPNH